MTLGSFLKKFLEAFQLSSQVDTTFLSVIFKTPQQTSSICSEGAYMHNNTSLPLVALSFTAILLSPLLTFPMADSLHSLLNALFSRIRKSKQCP